jgi:hypothetical protein
MSSARCWCHRSAAIRGRKGSRRPVRAVAWDLVDYTPTEPLLVVEVHTDTCFDHQRWRHPTAFKRVRAELDPLDLSPPGGDDE